MRKLQGFTLDDVLELYLPQYQLLLDLISKELKDEEKAYKKANRKK